jgi:hypothetical protein
MYDIAIFKNYINRKRYERSLGKAKIGEKVQFIMINEHFEPIFNAA